MSDLWGRALRSAGYDCEPTEENLRNCFTDYADSGIWPDVDPADVDDYSPNEMARGLIRYCGEVQEP